MNRHTLQITRRCSYAIFGAAVIVLSAFVAHAALSPYTDNISATKSQVVVVIAPKPDVPAAKPDVVPASVQPTVSEAAASELLAERRCLAEAIYYEARGEAEEGQKAIAEVIFHRMHSGVYPSTVCGVVFDGAQEKRACQFSFVCNGDMERPKNPRAWARARLLAAKIMSGVEHLGDMTGNATSYHAANVDPSWAGTLERTVQIGNHVFYKRPMRSRGT